MTPSPSASLSVTIASAVSFSMQEGRIDDRPSTLPANAASGQTGADGCGNLGNRHGLLETAHRTVGQR